MNNFICNQEPFTKKTSYYFDYGIMQFRKLQYLQCTVIATVMNDPFHFLTNQLHIQRLGFSRHLKLQAQTKLDKDW